MKYSVTSSLTSRPATINDLTTVSSIIFSCATRLSDQHHLDWSRYYTIDRLEDKLKNQTSFLFFANSVPIGVVFLSTNSLYYYSAADLQKFTDFQATALYLSTLAISPEYQHQGFATQIVNYCEDFAVKHQMKYLRLDCNSHDQPLVHFYQKRGFTIVAHMEQEPDYLLLEKMVQYNHQI
jgi:ribosomal protein S18 acetylase RimI-like enzyme